ncbi:serine protease 27-like [Eleutherodactylus coqui]|uniref:serine protease 27-like n=1 Tax=Eleutherodactylus coqui TaxID=57060 RepID=UPI0034618AB3
MKKKLLYVLVVLSVATLIPADASSVCGSPQVTERIVGGTDALHGEWPWQVSVLYYNTHICGGSLITSQWVLSAAHCFTSDSNIKNYEILLGAYKLQDRNSNEVLRGLEILLIHPQYSPTADKWDIALLKLSTSVDFTKYIMPICLPSSSVIFPCGMECWVTGWGNIATDVNLQNPRTLQKVMVQLIDHQTCNTMYHIDTSIDIYDNMICAGYSKGGKDSCQGDSGGPLVCNVNGIWYQPGVVSFGDGCALPNRPGVYTLVTSYESWIQSYITDLSFQNVTNIPEPTTKCSGNVNMSCYLLTLLIITASVLRYL